MTARRVLLLCVLALLLAAVVAALMARSAWQDWRAAQGIERLEWQGLQPGLDQLRLEKLVLHQEQEGGSRTLHLSDLRLTWQWQGLAPQAQSLSAAELALVLHPADAAPGTATPAIPPLPAEAPFWLPRQLTIHRFDASLPCATGRCTLKGTVSLSRQDQLLPLAMDLTLVRDGHRAGLSGHLAGKPPGELSLEATLSLDGQPRVSLQSRYRGGAESAPVNWSGELEAADLPSEDWVLAWLARWQPLPEAPLPLPPAGTEAHVSARWQVTAVTWEQLLRPEEGELSLHLALPQTWPVPRVGALQGELGMVLGARQGYWTPRELEADLTLTAPAAWAGAVPEALRPRQLRVRVQPEEGGPPDASPLLPLTLDVTTEGATPMRLRSRLALATQPPWRAELGPSRLEASHQSLALGELRLQTLAADLHFTGHMDEHTLAWQFSEDSRLTVGEIGTAAGDAGLLAQAGRLDLAGQTLSAEYSLGEGTLDSLGLDGPVALRLGELRHPVLKPQPWQGHGRLAVDRQRLATTLRLSADAGLAADVSLSYPFGGTLVVDAATTGLPAKAANRQFASLLAAWPETLAPESGQVSLEASLQQGPDRPRVVSGHLQLTDVTGIWDRTAINGLKARLNGKLEAGRFSLASDDLALAELNPGIPVGPIQLAALYSADVETPMAGRLELDQAEADFLGGLLRVPPGAWDLARMPVQVPLELERLELARLMELYPAEGLAGTGTLSGRVPVLIDRDGVRVEKGRVTALDPGGVLRLPAERIPGLGGGNQAMDVIAQALKNFHYSVLNSTIDYDQDGSLHLDLRLEGRNPEVRDGYPIVLNIDLEENLPALLTSLQLSGRVSEAVTERVRELVRQQGGELPD